LSLSFCLECFPSFTAPPVLGPVPAGSLSACILAAGVIGLLAVYRCARMVVNYDGEPFVVGLIFRNAEIYKLPAAPPAGVAGKDLPKPPVTAFEGGPGGGKGQFDNPHGIAVDSAGNIFVADTGNGRIQKFSPKGNFVTSLAN